jgi:hypothetical protein
VPVARDRRRPGRGPPHHAPLRLPRRRPRPGRNVRLREPGRPRGREAHRNDGRCRRPGGARHHRPVHAALSAADGGPRGLRRGEDLPPGNGPRHRQEDALGDPLR